VPDEPKPPSPDEKFPIELFTDDPRSRPQSATPPASRSTLPPPVTSPSHWPAGAKTSRAGDFWALVGCNAIVFGASVCIMIVELTASRLIANYIGQSLYTWTSVIGVVLAGISVGNYVGGSLADRHPPGKVLPWLFLVSGLLTLSVLFSNTWASNTQRPESMHWQWWVMLVVAWVFFLPALSLGTISPVTASMALKRSAKTGITVGNIYAWGALGSIVGTFLAGFWLIGRFGSREVIVMTSCALVVMGVLVAGGQRVFRTLALLAALPFIVQVGIVSTATAERTADLSRTIAGIRSGWRTTDADFNADEQAINAAEEENDDDALVAARARHSWRKGRKNAEHEWSKWGEKLGKQLHDLGRTLALRHDNPDEYNDESDYYAINISNTRVDGDIVKELRLDHLIHSYWNPDRPGKLYYDYEEVYAAVTERAAAQSGRTTAVRLEDFPAGEELRAAFPAGVEYDPLTKTLSIRGTMQLPQLRRLLTIGPYAELWQALFTTWEQAWRDWNGAARRHGGVLLTDLREFPDEIEFPPELAIKVHYDRVLRALVCTGSFTLAELIDLLAQGEMREYVEAVRKLYNDSRRVSALFIGGGGYVFPRWIEQSFPAKPRIDVAEIDPAVQTAVEQAMGLPAEYGPPEEGKTYVRTHIGDARKFVDDAVRDNGRRAARGEPPVTYDFVYGDAFNDLSVPWHLTTREFSLRIRDLLTPGRGVYLVNIIDIYPRAKHRFADLPEALLAAAPGEDNWEPAPAPFDRLQLRATNEEAFVLGFRGVMSPATRDDLLQHAGGDERLRDAIASLYARSRAEQVGQFLGRYLNTVCEIFPCVYLFTSNKGDAGELRDTFVVACSMQPLNFDNLYASGGYWKHGPFAWSERDAAGTAQNFGEMPAVLELARGRFLTDDFAPVDNLLAPVFVDRGIDR
jgi:hypothetical protein